MTDRTGPGPEAARGILADIRRLAAGSGPSPLRRRISLLGLGIALVLAGNMVGQVRLNTWHGRMFDALAQRGLADFGRQLVAFVGIVAFLLVAVVAQTWFQQLLKVALREWLTRRHLDGWLEPGRPYRMRLTGEPGASPDQRIQEDTRVLTDYTVELGAGLLQSTFLLVSFTGVLWALSSRVAFHVGDRLVTIPGYMVWCAVGYAAVGCTLTWLVGRRLVAVNTERYAREADFRFALVRVNESAESVALYGGERDERRVLDAALGPVIGAMRRLSGSIARLTWITSGYGWFAIVVPILAAAPGYFRGSLTIGGLMMVVGAFNQVQGALRWFVDNFPKLADWRAALGRVAWLHEALDRAREVDHASERVRVVRHPAGGLGLRGLTVSLRDGTVVVRRADAEIAPGERVLIVGASGAGKSTLFRAVAGLWTWGSGTIALPRASMMFMPQQPYLPLGTLRGAVTYPDGPGDVPARAVARALERVGLPALVPMLDREGRWDEALSVGQQQRLAFTRLLLHRPAWVFLDEATAALDEASQALVMSILDCELKDSAVVSIGHRPGLEAFHDRVLELVPGPDGSVLRPKGAVVRDRPRARERRPTRREHPDRIGERPRGLASGRRVRLAPEADAGPVPPPGPALAATTERRWPGPATVAGVLPARRGARDGALPAADGDTGEVGPADVPGFAE